MPRKILLADDSITIQKVVELTFSDGDYEVVAVNNGAKAIEKLSEARPSIILSDIIMPEKNGYEVCEYVKSHPEFRNIPVILLTGTFEPFDPDRAEKAGCDAVVTKPFESQSLIHKVDELIQQSEARGEAPAAAAPFDEEPTATMPWPAQPETQPAAGPFGEEEELAAVPGEEPAFEIPSMPPATPPEEERPEEEPPHDESTGGAEPWGESPFGEPAPEPDPLEVPPPATEPMFETHGEEIFYGAAEAAPAEELPLEGGAGFDFSGETRAFPKMTLDELQRMQESETADETEPAATRAFPALTREEILQMQAEEARGAEPAEAGPQEEPVYGGETRAFPKFGFDDLAAMQEEQPQEMSEPAEEQGPWPGAADASSADQPSPWTPPATTESPFEEELRAEEPAAEEPSPGEPLPFALDRRPLEEPEPFEAEPPSEEPAAFDAEVHQEEPTPFEAEAPEAAPAPFDAEAPEEEPTPFDAAPVEEETVAFEPAEEAPPEEETRFAVAEEQTPEEARPMEAAAALPPFEPEAAHDEEVAFEPPPAARSEEDEAALEGEVAHREAPPAETVAAVAESTHFAGALSDEQVERVARRVVEMLSDKVVRDIAWEVLPEMAEMIVRERIRELESEE